MLNLGGMLDAINNRCDRANLNLPNTCRMIRIHLSKHERGSRVLPKRCGHGGIQASLIHYCPPHIRQHTTLDPLRCRQLRISANGSELPSVKTFSHSGAYGCVTPALWFLPLSPLKQDYPLSSVVYRELSTLKEQVFRPNSIQLLWRGTCTYGCSLQPAKSFC